MASSNWIFQTLAGVVSDLANAFPFLSRKALCANRLQAKDPSGEFEQREEQDVMTLVAGAL